MNKAPFSSALKAPSVNQNKPSEESVEGKRDGQDGVGDWEGAGGGKVYSIPCTEGRGGRRSTRSRSECGGIRSLPDCPIKGHVLGSSPRAPSGRFRLTRPFSHELGPEHHHRVIALLAVSCSSISKAGSQAGRQRQRHRWWLSGSSGECLVDCMWRRTLVLGEEGSWWIFFRAWRHLVGRGPIWLGHAKYLKK